MPLTPAQKLYDLERRIERLEQALAAPPAPVAAPEATTPPLEPPRKQRIQTILEVVADSFGVRASDIRSRSRGRQLCDARQAAAYIITKAAHYTTTEAGRAINRHQSNASYLQRAAEERIDRGDAVFQDELAHAVACAREARAIPQEAA